MTSGMVHSPRLGGYAFAAALLLLWWAGSASGSLPENQIPSPGAVFLALTDNAPLFLDAVFNSLLRTLTAFAVGAAAGLGLGLGHGIFPMLRMTTGMCIEGLRPLPSIALIPLAILLFGMGAKLNVAIAAFACAWPIFINAYDGVRGINPLLLDTALTLGMTRRHTLRQITLPAALPIAFSGLRIGLGIAFAVEISVEMIIPKGGIGAFAINAALSGQGALLYAAIVTAALTGLALNQAFRRLEFLVLRNYGPEWSRQT